MVCQVMYVVDLVQEQEHVLVSISLLCKIKLDLLNLWKGILRYKYQKKILKWCLRALMAHRILIQS
jgi:hypothetical protein